MTPGDSFAGRAVRRRVLPYPEPRPDEHVAFGFQAIREHLIFGQMLTRVSGENEIVAGADCDPVDARQSRRFLGKMQGDVAVQIA